MTVRAFFRDKIGAVLLYLCCAVIFTPFLYFAGAGFDELLLVLISSTLVLAAYLIYVYMKQKYKYAKMNGTIERMDKKYLFTELANEPDGAIDQIYFSLMRRALKAMTDQVSQAEHKQVEYKQFIEQWIHEIKRPIAASKLICENNKNEHTRRIISQIEEIDVNVERALYYARLGYVEKDYLIQKISVLEIVEESLARNKQLLIQNNARIEKNNLDCSVYCDGKWIVFILNQIILNSIQYKKDNLVITIEAVDLGNQIALSITDNGVGIKASEISRIFQLGFTGSNGRRGKSATGIGLYLCKELCLKLGLSIGAKSELDKYTCIKLYFPKNEKVKV